MGLPHNFVNGSFQADTSKLAANFNLDAGDDIEGFRGVGFVVTGEQSPTTPVFLNAPG